MKLFSKIILVGVFAVFLAGNAMALPIVPSDTTLQDYFDAKSWGLDAVKDQIDISPGFQLTNASGASNMVLYREVPADATYEFGVYSLAGGEKAIVFDSTDTAVAMATVRFDTSEAIVVQYLDAGGSLIDQDNYAFTGTSFGFYISNGTHDYYSDPDENRGVVGLLGYKADAGSYVFAGELSDPTDGNFSDIVIQAESIKPVPEPAAMFLLGFGLLGLAGVARKKTV